MAKNYEVGEKYYLPVKVYEVVNTNYGVKISFEDGAGEDTTRICDMPDVLLTASEIAAKVRYRRNVEQENRFEELERENQELKEENGKLTANVDALEAELNNAKALNEFAVKTEQTREKLIAEQRELMKKYSLVIDVLIDKITALRKGESNG
jgi:predicted RNase H-like nuclease (RuvC/YqgF family)